MTFRLAPSDRLIVLKIVLVYAIFGGIWIALSDKVLGLLVRDPDLMTRIATYKGLLFIIVTALLLYYLVGRYVYRLGDSQRRLDDNTQQLKLASFTFANIADAVYWVAPDSSVVFANAAACRMSGYSLEELLTMKVADIDPSFPLKEWEPHWKELKQSGSIKLETTHITKDQRIYEVEVVANYFTYLGREYNCAIVRDISDRRRIENLLRKNEALLNATIESLPFEFFAIDTSGRYILQNATTQRHWGDVIGKHPDELHAPSPQKKKWIDNNNRALAGEFIQGETVCDLPEGTQNLLEILSPIRDRNGNILGALGINIDQSDQKKAEQDLRKSEEKLRSVLSLMPVGVVCASNEGIIDYVNPDFVSRFGYTLNDVPTLTEWFLKAYPDRTYREELMAIWAEQHEQAVNQGMQIPPREVKVTCGNGTTRDVLINTHTSPDGVMAIFTDITEQKARRSELQKKQKLESIGVLAGGIAHDFNNILTAILGNISFAKKMIESDHKAMKPLQDAERASLRAAELAHQLLTFSKGGQPVIKAVDLRTVIAESVSLVLRGSNVVAQINIGDDVRAIKADEGQISQVFNNLVLNAVQAMPGGGTISILVDTINMDSNNIVSIQPGNYVRIQVSDQGCGIPDENLAKIFDPYFTTKSGGSGLGLASVHSIISKHNGYIGVRSSQGRGTTFEILLPTSQAIPEAHPSDIPKPAPRPEAPLSVLVMDDEEMIRDLVVEFLSDLGYHVTTSSHGQETIDLYRAAFLAGVPFQAVIMDLTIPGGMGGKEAAAALLEIDPHAYLIVSSGYSNDPIVANYREYGFSGVVLKPYTVADLAAALSPVAAQPSARSIS